MKWTMENGYEYAVGRDGLGRIKTHTRYTGYPDGDIYRIPASRMEDFGSSEGRERLVKEIIMLGAPEWVTRYGEILR